MKNTDEIMGGSKEETEGVKGESLREGKNSDGWKQRQRKEHLILKMVTK